MGVFEGKNKRASFAHVKDIEKNTITKYPEMR